MVVIRYLVYLALCPVWIVLLYLLAALAGGAISLSGSSDYKKLLDDPPPIYLLVNALHADIAIPVNDDVRRKFAFLRNDGFPLNDTQLKYLVIGWGSKKFYTSTKAYKDIGFATTWTAVTGDQSVMHVQVAGELRGVADRIALKMNRDRFMKMLEFIDSGFARDQGAVQVLQGTSFGDGDRFYEGVGDFNVFRTCNVWTSQALREAGFGIGLWTPTTFSVRLAHWLHN